MLVTSLGSGSSGNSLLVTSGGTSLLIDAGVAARRVTQALARAGGPPRELNGILLSHEHHDHVRGLATLLKGQRCPVWSTAGTQAYLARGLACEWLPATGESSFS
ncbi:MAG TPA: MBL fold metallo-hydrolase, partial [Thermomicrobiaceae bacterium]|nr:MBL fold metallo-hydrolase [Thermomicrobiaceae bacterium]